MKTTPFLALTMLAGAAWAGEGAALQLLPANEPVRMFAGGERTLAAMFRNATQETAEAAITLRLLQATSATAVFLEETPWKTLQVFPGQTILESARIKLPLVRGETRFIVQWIANGSQVIGTTDVLAYPPTLLNELEALAGEENILGIFDPQGEIKPRLAAAGLAFQDLEETGVASFRGRLAILGPFPSQASMPAHLTASVREMTSKGVAVVWIQPPPGPRAKLQPAFHIVRDNQGAVVVMDAGLVLNFEESPRAQLNLIHCARLALRPEPLGLPETLGR